MDDELGGNHTPLEDRFERRRFLKYSGAVAGIGLGSTSAVADDTDEAAGPEGTVAAEATDVETTSTEIVNPHEELTQTWYYTIFCPGLYCEPGPFTVTGLLEVEHVETGLTHSFDEQSWTQGYETVARTWELGTPTEWADALGLEHPEGQWNVNGEMLRDGVLVDSETVPIEVGCPLKPKIEAKRDSIGTIRTMAEGFGLPRESVDQNAEALLDGEIADEDDCADAEDEDELEQLEEALDRMIAAEEVTERSTAVATEPGGTLERIAGLLVEVAKAQGTKLIRRKAGGLTRRFVNGVVTRVVEGLNPLLDSYAGRGVIDENVFNTIQRRLNSIAIYTAATVRAVDDGDHDYFDPEDNPWEKIIEEAFDGGATAAKQAGDGLGITDAIESRLEDVPGDASDPQTGLEQLLFRGYYESPWVSEIHVPAPSELEIPDVDVTVQLPTEFLPDWELPAIDDEITISMETPAIPLPDVPVFTDVHEVRTSLGTDPGEPSGVNTSIDDRMASLQLHLEDLQQQNATAREHVRDVFAGGIDAIDDVADAIHENADWLGSKVGWFEDTLSNMTAGLLIASGLLFVTIKGIPLAIKAAAVAVKAAVFGAKLAAFQTLIDLFQASVGAGVTLYYANLHHVGVTGLVEDDLGGVSHG